MPTILLLLGPPFLPSERLSEKKWVVRDGMPRCKKCHSLLQPVDEPPALKCTGCGRSYRLTESELAELTFDLSD